MAMIQLVQGVRTALDIKRDRLIRLNEVLRIAGVGKSTWYALMAAGKAPHCLQITPRCVAWSEEAVYAWVEARKAEAGAQASMIPSGVAS